MGNHTDIGYIFLYVAAFGFSDYIVEKYKLFKHEIYYMIYYILILVIGFIIIRNPYNIIEDNHPE